MAASTVGTIEEGSDERFARMPLQQLEDEIAEFAAHADAVVYQTLIRLVAFERREGWGGGFATCAHWLSWRTGVDLGAARERMRVARALERLPAIAWSLRTAAISYSKVRAITRIATPDNEAALLEIALHGTASQVERLVRAWRRVDRQEEARLERERHASRFLQLLPNEDGTYELKGRLDPEVAMTLKRALEAASWQLYRDRSPGAESTVPQRRADAIGIVSECALRGEAIGGTEEEGPETAEGMEPARAPETAERPEAADGREAAERLETPERMEAAEPNRVAAPHRPPTPARTLTPPDHRLVIVHVDRDALIQGSAAGDAVLEDGTRVSAETSRRLACDAARVLMVHDRDGSIADVGRRSRAVPPSLRRALDHRDGGCRFPGCGSRFCDAHHVRHWADGGQTTLANLVLLCRVHHRAVHEEGFSVTMLGGVPRFRRPNGVELPEAPAPAPLPWDPIARIHEREVQEGVEISSESGAPLWSGERLDLEWTLGALWRPRVPEGEGSERHGSERGGSRDGSRQGSQDGPARPAGGIDSAA